MLDSLTIDFGGTDDALVQKLRGPLYQKVFNTLKLQLETEAEGLRQAIVDKINSEFNTDSGNLADSVQVTGTVVSDKTVIVTVEAAGQKAPYGAYFERGGRGPYPIRPINKKALSFLPTSNVVTFKYFGKTFQEAVARNSVIHPAIPKRPFVRNTVEERRAQIIANLRAAIQSV